MTMKSSPGLNRYLYEYLFHQAIETAREETGEIVPISQAKAIRRTVARSFAAAEKTANAERAAGTSPVRLGPKAFAQKINEAVAGAVPEATAPFADGQAVDRALSEFTSSIGLNSRAGRGLPISPYDPEWSRRASVRQGGTALSYIAAADVDKVAGGRVEGVVSDDPAEYSPGLTSPANGQVPLWRVDARDESSMVEAGPAMSDEDAAGLTSLQPFMSATEYASVREWVLDGARNPTTGVIDRNQFMTGAALERSVAVLTELQAQGVDYEVLTDRIPGQIRAKLAGSGMELRLTDSRRNEAVVGARVYDNGVTTRFSLGNDQSLLYSPSPDEAVALLRVAQGRSVERTDRPGEAVGGAESYHPGRGQKLESVAMLAFGNARGDASAKLYIRREAKHRSLAKLFVKEEPAAEFLSSSVTSARENLVSALEVEDLIAEYDRQAAVAERDAFGEVTGELMPPEFSADAEIAAIQRSYWDVLSGRRGDLLRPGATQEMYDARLGEIGEDVSAETAMGNLVYGGTASEKVRAHADEVADELIGTAELQPHVIDGELVDKRFDALRVSRYMTSENGQFRNLDDLASACRRLNVEPNQMLGTSFQANRFADRLVGFDEAGSVPMSEHSSPFVRRMGEAVTGAISRSAATPTSVDIDENGVITWSALKQGRSSQVPIQGVIGQIFEPGSHGEIVTAFASGENALVVPGFEARIAAQRFGETKSVEERTILRGYEQLMTERVEHQIAGDITAARSVVGDPASLNGVYSGLYGTKHPVDFIERAMVTPEGQHVMTSAARDDAFAAGDMAALAADDVIRANAELDGWTKSIIDTEASRIRYTNDIRDGSTMFAAYQAKKGRDDPADDIAFDAWKLTGGRNMRVLTGRDSNGVVAPDGYLDPIMTGGAGNQGVVRYLTTDASVGADGRIVPGDPATLTGSRAPLMTRAEMSTLEHDAFDRQQMTASTIMQSSSVTEQVGTAMMTFGGWTADDPIVVSKEFAEANMIRGAGGQERPLVVGDKISDFHGNKGVLSLIVDRDMDMDEARAQGVFEEVAWFQANPNMDVVMSPFSLISRRNAGSARELMSGDVQPLNTPVESMRADDLDLMEPEARAGMVGQMQFVVTHMAVDEKTKIYDDEQILAGRGRKASSQLSWALSSQDCPSIMREFYGPNAGAEANLREYLTTMGIEMDATGSMRLAGAVTDGSEVSTDAPTRRFFAMPDLERTVRGNLDTRKMVSVFRQTIGDKGGDMEIPFPLTLPTGETTEQVSPTSWKLPVLSSHLRSGQEFEDGSVVSHDYTNRYLDIFKESCTYRAAAEKSVAEGASSKDKAAADESMRKAAQRGQRRFEAITKDLETRVLTGRNNYFKNGLMASRLPDSATAVWTSDPRLDINKVSMGPGMADQLGLKAGDHALIWRDPVLREDGVRYMEVALDERLTGVAINPAMAKCFDGDFDGDAVAVVKLHSEAAKAEALEKLSVPANLLDHSVPESDGSYPLGMNVSLDTKVALSQNAELAEEFESARREINRVELEVRQAGSTPAAEAEARPENQTMTEELSDLYRSSQRQVFGDALRFDSRESHLKSLREVCVDTGAKGSEAKLNDYAHAFGGEDGKTGLTRKDQEGTMLAAGMKSDATGLGGGVAQRVVRVLHNIDPEAATQLTSRVTQGFLQAKHDPTEAEHLYDMGQTAVRDLWRGRSIEHVGGGQWKPEFEDGAPVQATRDQWVGQFTDFYSSKAGLGIGVNPLYVERVADALVDPATGRMRNIEEMSATPLDRMAYGGQLEDLVEMAKTGENIYEGEHNARFAPAATANARRASQRAEMNLDTEFEAPANERVAESLIKPDVMAEGQDKAAARGSRRRSSTAVAVGAGSASKAWRPSIEIEDAAEGNDMERQG